MDKTLLYIVNAQDKYQPFGYTVGVFSSKELADIAAEEDKTSIGDNSHLFELEYTVSEVILNEAL